MTNVDMHPKGETAQRSRRSRRSDRDGQLFASRPMPEAEVSQSAETPEPYYYPNEEETSFPGKEYAAPAAPQRQTYTYDESAYTPNEPARPYEVSAALSRERGRTRRRARYEETLQNQPEQPKEETIAFSFASVNAAAPETTAYRRPEKIEETAGEPSEDQFAYAPPVKLQLGAYGTRQMNAEAQRPLYAETEYGTSNIYRPRSVDYSLPEEAGMDTETDAGYQVHEEEKPRAKKKHKWPFVVFTILALALAAAFLLFPEAISGLFSKKTPGQEEVKAVIATPSPVKSFDAANPVPISPVSGSAISRVSGTVSMTPHVVTETSIMTRNDRGGGKYDFYLFTAAEGRLLAYFENLGIDGVSPLPEGGYFVRQKPYLISEDGTALMDEQTLSAQVEGEWTLAPLWNGYSVITETETGKMNLTNREGQLLSRFWLSRLWPMSGQCTVGYVDTGNAADPDNRYTRYLFYANGQTEKWCSEGSMDTVVFSVMDMAYLNNGELYHLDDISAPLITTDQVVMYADCGAMVVRDPSTGKYGMYVDGQQHYDCVFDEIRPVGGEIEWASEQYTGEYGAFTLCYVAGAAYPQPLTHYFLLTRDGVEEYVALSTHSVCPVVLK